MRNNETILLSKLAHIRSNRELYKSTYEHRSHFQLLINRTSYEKKKKKTSNFTNLE